MIKTQIINKKNEPIDLYPKLMINTITKDLIVRFTSRMTGIVVCQGSSCHEFGYISTSWLLPNFEDFDGELILSNIEQGESK